MAAARVLKKAATSKALARAKLTSAGARVRSTTKAKATTKATAKAKATARAPAALRGIRAVVINLERRPDRWEKAKRSLGKAAPWLQVARLSAVDGKASPPAAKDVTKKWSTARLAERFPWYLSKTVPMSPGERGCCGSHIEAWKLAARQRRPLLVIEDDAVALKSFTSSLAQAVKEAPRGTGAIFLSSKDRGWAKKVGKVLMKPSFVWTTVGYLIYPEAAKTLLKMRPLDMPVDNWLAYHIQVGAVKAFSVKPAGLRQAQSWNVGSDVPHSDDVAYR